MIRRDIRLSDFYRPKEKQKIAHASPKKYTLFGGAMGGGKSYYLSAEAMMNCLEHPGNRWALVRETRTIIKSTLWVTFFKVFPPGCGLYKKINNSTLEVELINGSKIMFMGIDVRRDPNLDNLKSLEIGGFGIEEASQIPRAVYKILRTRLRWTLPDGSSPRYIGRLTSNPEDCWLYDEFIQPSTRKPEAGFIKSLTLDNYDENDEYYKELLSTFADDPDLMERYLKGNWEISDKIDQLISQRAIINALGAAENKTNASRSLGVDIARMGDDKTVFTIMNDGDAEKVIYLKKNLLNEVVDITIQLIETYQIAHQHVAIDAVGLGAGVYDMLVARGYQVTAIIAGAKAEEKEGSVLKFFNVRSEMYWRLREDFNAGRIGNLNTLPNDIYDQLSYELRSTRYKINSERQIQIISKEQIKKVIGVSPDYADSFAMANYVRHLTPRSIDLNDYDLTFQSNW